MYYGVPMSLHSQRSAQGPPCIPPFARMKWNNPCGGGGQTQGICGESMEKNTAICWENFGKCVVLESWALYRFSTPLAASF